MPDEVRDDVGRSLHQIRTEGRQPLISQMLELQDKQWECRTKLVREHDFVCLKIDKAKQAFLTSPRSLRRVRMSQTQQGEGKFVAVSHRCHDHTFYQCKTGGYHILVDPGCAPRKSITCDQKLERVIKYANHYRVSAFWIDQECVDQKDRVARQTAIRGMDLIYRCSKHKLAILTYPIQQQNQLDLLHSLVRGDLVITKGPRQPKLSPGLGRRKARQVLGLLHYLVQDPWWTRRWTFQEDYCSSGKMKLMIPHALNLDKSMLRDSLGNIPGEALVTSATFRERATDFCKAYRTSPIHKSRADRERIRLVSQRAESYRRLQSYMEAIQHYTSRMAMSTRILKDILDRDVFEPADTLAIFANCCGYTVRPREHQLSIGPESSLSLAIIAMFLLNGEILWNNRRSPKVHTVMELLQTLSFSKFKPPIGCQKLTFMKQCRFVDVLLTPDGLRTTGHLWQVQEIVHIKVPRLSRGRYTETIYNRLLLRLASKLQGKYNKLAKNLRRCAKASMPACFAACGSEKIYRQMIASLAKAIEAGDQLMVVRHLAGKRRWGLFTCSPMPRSTPLLVFTASENAVYSPELKQKWSPVKHVSIVVYQRGTTTAGLRRLHPVDWVNGLSFPDGHPTEDVVYPWPAVLRAPFRP